MTFINTERPSRTNTEFKKTEFIDLTPGQTIIRILPGEIFTCDTHYVKGISVKCLGDECPICSSNRKLIAENPETFRSVAGYSPKSFRFAVNVLDKSPVKICKNCNHEVKKFQNSYPPVCPSCNHPIVAEPEIFLNKVKVLSKGRTLADQLNAAQDSVLDSTGTPVGITNFDIVLSVTGTGRDQKIAAIPLSDRKDPPVYLEESLFDLSRSVVTLTAEELGDLQKGISLRDIFSSRKTGGTDVENLANKVETANKAIMDRVQSLFEPKH